MTTNFNNTDAGIEKWNDRYVLNQWIVTLVIYLSVIGAYPFISSNHSQGLGLFLLSAPLFIISLPILIVSVFLYKFLIKKATAPSEVKTTINMVVIASVMLLQLFFNDFTEPVTIVVYSLAVIFSSMILKIKKKKNSDFQS